MNNADARLAARIAAERARRGWSLADLAARSGVSRAMIHKVERGGSSPTAALLGRLAAAFGLTVSKLFAEPGPDRPRIARAAGRRPWRDPETGLLREQLSPLAGPASLEATRVTLPAGRTVAYPAEAFADLRQLVIVETGTLTFAEGERRHVLGPGDCLELGAPAASAFINEGTEPCAYLVIVAQG